jgi:flavin reductase (DIM6/NTAB) family NADH-FMN oxidoreductase RutF
MSIDESRFRQVMGYFPSGVTVVTTEHRGQHFGLTVSSFTSLSLRPPLVLVCIDKLGVAHTALMESGRFAVHILAEHQEHLSRRFAAREGDKFAGVSWQRGELGVPVLAGVLAAFECRTTDRLPGGDHTIFVGEVINTTINEGAPLLYYRGGYHELK